MKWHIALSAVVALAVLSPHALAQGGGGFGGGGMFAGGQQRDPGVPVWPGFSDMDGSSVTNYITIEGTAERRVAPEKIRVVLAVTSQAESAAECRKANAKKIDGLLKQWKSLGISEEDVEQDFIALLPVYEWRLADRDEQEVRIQQLENYRVQSNVHVLVDSEEAATDAVNAALEANVNDIVTFDYWSSELDDQKREVRQAALEAAKQKAELLLAAFDEQPPLINVREQTASFPPYKLYRTFENVLEESVDWPSGYRDVPRIRAFRPKMTFLGGVDVQADVQAKSLPMRAEITVVSTVRLYYQSPARECNDD